MATEFFGVLDIDFETDQDVSEETFKKFRKDFLKMVDENWEMMLYDLAEKHGFDISTVHPIYEGSDFPLQDKDKI